MAAAKMDVEMAQAAALILLLTTCAGLSRAQEPRDQRADAPRNVGFRVLELGEAAAVQTITVAVWYPTRAAPARHVYGGPTVGHVAVDSEPLAGPCPLLVFSHGYGGGGIAHAYLAEPLAARGWIVAAPDHGDRYVAVRIRTGAVEGFDRRGFLRHAAEIAGSGPEDRDAYAYRWDELRLALDGMLGHETFGRLVDAQRVAVGGHSFGGFTALGLCGTIEARRDARVKAVLLLSSGAAGYLYRDEELARVRVPSLFFLGEAERDQRRGDRTMEQIAEEVFGALAPPKHLLVVAGANHFSFNHGFSERAARLRLCGTQEQLDVIQRYAVAFLERYVAGREEAATDLDAPDPRLTERRAQAR